MLHVAGPKESSKRGIAISWVPRRRRENALLLGRIAYWVSEKNCTRADVGSQRETCAWRTKIESVGGNAGLGAKVLKTSFSYIDCRFAVLH